jgi:hypothetical protein
MAGLDPAIHLLMDPRVKPAGDDVSRPKNAATNRQRAGDAPGAKFCTFCRSRTFIFMPLLMMMSPGF